MSHRPGHDGIAEILESGQFPGTTIRTQVRSAVLRDGNGQEIRVIYGGGIDSAGVEKDMQNLAESDGLDLSTAEFKELVPELGQSISKRGGTAQQVRRRPRRRTRDISVTPVPEPA